MSTLYNLEPQPTASLIFHTTLGPISLELFASQTPLTSRNFLQLCLDGYYNGTHFHRLIPGFILQGGDPTNTGHGGESIYDHGALGAPRPPEGDGIWPMEERTGMCAGVNGVGFKDEFHSRLKFNRRGLLGMANEGPNTNLSQFFLTLGPTPELQGKNTLFGRVAGDTIYNLARAGGVEVENERPVYPIVVQSVEVLENPFKDMVAKPRTVQTQRTEPAASKPKTKRKKPAKTLLSFGDEERGEEAPILKKKKFDERIVMDDPNAPSAPPPPPPKSEKPKSKPKPENVLHKSASRSPSPPPKRTALKRSTRSPSTSPEPEPVTKVSSLLDKTNQQIAELKASLRRDTAPVQVKEKPKSALEAMIPSTSIRGRKRKAGGSGKDDLSALNLLKQFQRKLEEAPPEEVVEVKDVEMKDSDDAAAKDGKKNEEDEEAALCDLHFIADCQSCKKWDENTKAKEDDDDRGWMSHALSFTADKLGKDLNYRKKAEEELVVIDPREKERTLKEERRAKREGKAGTGREWDRSGDARRNDKLAQQSRNSGRGAR